MQFSLTIVLVLVCVLLVDAHIQEDGEHAGRKEARRQRKENSRQLKNYQMDQNKNWGNYYGRGHSYGKRSTNMNFDYLGAFKIIKGVGVAFVKIFPKYCLKGCQSCCEVIKNIPGIVSSGIGWLG